MTAAGWTKSSTSVGRFRPSGQWPMFMHGPSRRGRTVVVGAQSPHLAWEIPGQLTDGSPSVGLDGTIYVASAFPNRFWAINPNGSVKWSVEPPNDVEQSSAILLDGRIAFVDNNGNVHVVNPDGRPSWQFQSGITCACPFLGVGIGRDGAIYAPISDTLFVLSPDGTLLWSYDVGRGIEGPVAILPDGTVYIAAGALFALDSIGSLLWSYTPPNTSLGGAPAVGVDGTIYVNSFSPDLFAINPDGTLKWRHHAGTCCVNQPTSPAIGRDGTIYVAEWRGGFDYESELLALSPTGTAKWGLAFLGIPASPAIGGDGTIYLGIGFNTPGGVYAVNPDGTVRWRFDDPLSAAARTSPVIGVGRVYGGSEGGLFAIGP